MQQNQKNKKIRKKSFFGPDNRLPWFRLPVTLPFKRSFQAIFGPGNRLHDSGNWLPQCKRRLPRSFLAQVTGYMIQVSGYPTQNSSSNLFLPQIDPLFLPTNPLSFPINRELFPLHLPYFPAPKNYVQASIKQFSLNLSQTKIILFQKSPPTNFFLHFNCFPQNFPLSNTHNSVSS